MPRERCAIGAAQRWAAGDLEQLVHLGLVEDAVCVAVALADEAQHFNVALYVIVIALEQSMHVFFRDHSVAIFVNLRPGPPEDL